jgi:hypothetical protein
MARIWLLGAGGRAVFAVHAGWIPDRARAVEGGARFKRALAAGDVAQVPALLTEPPPEA